WEQLSQVPLSSLDQSGLPVLPGFDDQAPPLQSGYSYQPGSYQEAAASGTFSSGPPLGMQQLMSGLSQSAMAAQSNSARPLARLAPPPPALRSEGRAAEVTSAWF